MRKRSPDPVSSWHGCEAGRDHGDCYCEGIAPDEGEMKSSRWNCLGGRNILGAT